MLREIHKNFFKLLQLTLDKLLQTLHNKESGDSFFFQKKNHQCFKSINMQL